MIHLKFYLYCIIVLDNNKVFISGSRILKNISVNASGLLWQRSGHPIVLVAQESKLCSGESKHQKF